MIEYLNMCLHRIIKGKMRSLKLSLIAIGLLLVAILSFGYATVDDAGASVVEFSDGSDYVGEDVVIKNVVDFEDGSPSSVVVGPDGTLLSANLNIGENGTVLEIPGYEPLVVPEKAVVTYELGGDPELEIVLPDEKNDFDISLLKRKDGKPIGDVLISGNLETVFGSGTFFPNGVYYNENEGFYLIGEQSMLYMNSYGNFNFKLDEGMKDSHVKVVVGGNEALEIDKKIPAIGISVSNNKFLIQTGDGVLRDIDGIVVEAGDFSAKVSSSKSAIEVEARRWAGSNVPTYTVKAVGDGYVNKAGVVGYEFDRGKGGEDPKSFLRFPKNSKLAPRKADLIVVYMPAKDDLSEEYYSFPDYFQQTGDWYDFPYYITRFSGVDLSKEIGGFNLNSYITEAILGDDAFTGESSGDVSGEEASKNLEPIGFNDLKGRRFTIRSASEILEEMNK